MLVPWPGGRIPPRPPGLASQVPHDHQSVLRGTNRPGVSAPARTEDELRQAVDLVDRAAAADLSNSSWAHPYILFAQGLAEYRQGRLDRAISTMREDAPGALGPPADWFSPWLCTAADSWRSTQNTGGDRPVLRLEARQALDQDGWICHVLRREAEGMILPNLPAFLDGKYQPQDDDERLALMAAQLATWEFRGLPGATGGIEANGQQQVAAWERAIAEYRQAGHRTAGQRHLVDQARRGLPVGRPHARGGPTSGGRVRRQPEGHATLPEGRRPPGMVRAGQGIRRHPAADPRVR